MIDKTQYIFAFIRDNKMIFQNDKSIVSYILTHTQESADYNKISQSNNKLFTTKGYYFHKFISL